MLALIDKLVNSVGNIVHDSVPVSNNEDNNLVVRTWGDIPDIKITDKRGALNHHKVLQALGGYDPERGQKVAGHRGYFLKGAGVLLNNALVNYGLTFSVLIFIYSAQGSSLLAFFLSRINFPTSFHSFLRESST